MAEGSPSPFGGNLLVFAHPGPLVTGWSSEAWPAWRYQSCGWSVPVSPVW
jgi:hypothetical protein